MATQQIRIGTRGSPLALAQTEEVRRRLLATHAGLTAAAIQVVVIRTTGDRELDRPLAEIGGKGLFTKEIDEALLADRVDLAVNSLKDVPTQLPAGIVLPCVLPREDPRDALISRRVTRLADLPPGAVVGSTSLRRQAQVLARRPDLRVVMFRGNVETRIRKIDEGQADATLLALAGLKRLGLAHLASAVLSVDEMLPAVGQGAIGITCRAGDERVHALLSPLNDPPSMERVTAERAMLAALEGSCRTPIAALAEIEGGDLVLRGLVARSDGSGLTRGMRRGAPREAAALGDDLGRELRCRAAPDPAGDH